jgi:hypothetical protein
MSTIDIPSKPLPTVKATLSFLKKTPSQQLELVQTNPYYLTELRDWIETIESEEDLVGDDPKLLPHLGRLQELLQQGQEYYSNLTQTLAQLRATNRQLQEENNRLSSAPEPPHKDPQFSVLQEQYASLATTYNELVKSHKEQEATLNSLYYLYPLENQTPEELISAVKGTIRAESITNKIISENRRAIDDWTQAGKLLLLPGERTTLTPKQFAVRLQERMAAMSGVIEGNTLSPENISTFWKQIPEGLRNSKDAIPTTSVELLEALSKLECRHPRELAETLGSTPTQAWNVSLGQVQTLLSSPFGSHPSARQVPTPTRTELFKVSDIPAFEKRSEYGTYRATLQRFFSSLTRTPDMSEVGPALNRILASWTSPEVRQASVHWNINTFITYDVENPETGDYYTLPSTWEQAKKAFLSACDYEFLSVTAAEDSIKELMALRPKTGQDPSTFLLDFNSAINKRDAMCAISEIPPLPASQITSLLIGKIPTHVRNEIRKILSSQMPPRILETMLPAELRPLIINIWTYTPDPRPVPRASAHVTHASPGARNTSGQPNGSPRPRQCGLIIDYDTAPAVDHSLRGSINPDPSQPENLSRRQLCAQKQVCMFCRRPRSQHQSSGPNFRLVTMTPRASRTPVAAIEAAPTQLRIEAAPPSQ